MGELGYGISWLKIGVSLKLLILIYSIYRVFPGLPESRLPGITFLLFLYHPEFG